MVSGIIHEPVECDKRVRREIANSNERRRMQSINAGFEQLKVLLPSMSDCDKLSKANILKLTAKYINNLVNRIHNLESEVATLKGRDAEFVNEVDHNANFSKKRKLTEHRVIPVKKHARMRDSSPKRSNLLLHHDSVQTSPIIMPHLSPISSAPSFCNESQSSPEPSEGNNASRLEDLVMAIEKIEGDLAQSQTDLDSSSEGSDWPTTSSGSSKPVLIHCDSPAYESEETKPYASSTSQTILLKSVPSNGSMVNIPLVAKMLNQGAIPHKYLHRPQVVVNSSN